jgi:hypothetical protein
MIGMGRHQAPAWGAIVSFTTTSACLNRGTLTRRQESTGKATPWQQRPPAIDRILVLTLGSTSAIRKEFTTEYDDITFRQFGKLLIQR